jgi:hypothetical protein
VLESGTAGVYRGISLEGVLLV